ncbi:MAG: hypothetical protein LAP21_05930 [Acidobacteriia bacterium]|nr:hypothetical protein [Terriglobia bacterium]
MFELYTEQAKRAIFFARWWAQQTNSPYIETPHLILGLAHLRKSKAEKLFHLREHRDLFMRSIPGMITRGNVTIAKTEIPLDIDSKYVLHFTAEEAARLNNRFIGYWANGVFLPPSGRGSLGETLFRPNGCEGDNGRLWLNFSRNNGSKLEGTSSTRHCEQC